MSLANEMQKIYETKWSFINSFSMFMELPPALINASGWHDYSNIDLQKNIISVDLPQYSNSPIESFVANRWLIHNGRDELYRFTVTFRDEDQLKLYRKFTLMYHASREQYFDDAKIWISIFKDADWLHEQENKPILTLQGCMIENVSQVQFSNDTENQIAEFTVGFKAPIVYPEN